MTNKDTLKERFKEHSFSVFLKSKMRIEKTGVFIPKEICEILDDEVADWWIKEIDEIIEQTRKEEQNRILEMIKKTKMFANKEDWQEGYDYFKEEIINKIKSND